MIKTTGICFSVEEYFKRNKLLNESELKELTINTLKLLEKEKILLRKLKSNWCEYKDLNHPASKEEILDIRKKVNQIKQEIWRIRRASKEVLGFREKNKMLDLSKLFDISSKLVLSKTRFDEFFRVPLKIYKRIKKNILSCKFFKHLNLEQLQESPLKIGQNHFQQNSKNVQNVLNKFQKFSLDLQQKVKNIEDVSIFLNSNNHFNKTQHQIWKEYLNLTSTRLSFGIFRSVCRLLEFKFRPIMKTYRENDIVKEARIRMLGKLLELKKEHPKTVFFFDCTSFNWNQKSHFCWQVKNHPLAFPPIIDFRAVHLLMIISLEKVVAFQLIAGKLCSEIICSFLLQVFEKERPQLNHQEVHIVLDNAKMHHTDLMKKLASCKKMKFHFIVPRNPFFNIIEFVFRFIKTRRPKTLPLKKLHKKRRIHQKNDRKNKRA